ncbi:MAG: hypothetical protein ACLTR9_02610 [Bifidobacterium bifidum]
MSHYGPSDISLRHAELAGKVTRTDKQMQQAAKQDEKARRRHTGKRRITQSKADQKNKQDDNRHKNIHIYDQSRKPKTMTTQKKTMRVLHPATRMTPENVGIPPFYRVC